MTARPTVTLLATRFCAAALSLGWAFGTYASELPDNARQYGDSFISCSEWTRLSHDPSVMKKPWPENVFLRYASWTTGFVSGATVGNPALRTTSAAEIIKNVSSYCAEHPSNTIEQASAAYVAALSRRKPR